MYIDERFMAADLHITLGFIEQHLMLGFSGGRKLIAPGLAAQETIKVIHSPRFMREPMATEGSIADNPLHAELLEIARMARHDFVLDVTLTQDRQSPAFLRASRSRRTLLEWPFLSRLAWNSRRACRRRDHQRSRLPA